MRTLVCVFGQIRGSKTTWSRFKENVLDQLDADLAVCLSEPSLDGSDNDYWQNATYRWTCPEYDDWGDAFDTAMKHSWPNGDQNWRRMLAIQDQWLGGIKGPNEQQSGGAILLFFRWLLWQNIVNQGLLEVYDRFVITRSDFVWLSPHPPMQLLDESLIWVPNGEHYSGITDRHAVLSRQNIEMYLNLIRPIFTETEALYTTMQWYRSWNIERYIDLRIRSELGTYKVGYFLYTMYLIREKGDKSRWSLGDWNEELGYYVKYPSEYALANSNAMWIHNTQNWHEGLMAPSMLALKYYSP